MSICHSPPRYLALKPCSRATASTVCSPRVSTCALGQRHGQVLFQRQASALVGVEDNSLQVHRGPAARVGELAIELPDARQRSLVQSLRVVWGEKRKPSGNRTAWPATSLAASRYFVTSAGDMTSALSGVGKPFPGRAVHGELPCRIERFQAREVAERIGVLGIAQPPEHHRPRIACLAAGHGGKEAAHPLLQSRTFGRVRLGAAGGGIWAPPTTSATRSQTGVWPRASANVASASKLMSASLRWAE